MSWIRFDFDAFVPKKMVISDSVNSFDVEFYLNDWDRLIPTNLSIDTFLRSLAKICRGCNSLIYLPHIAKMNDEKYFSIEWIGWITWDVYWEDVEGNVIQIHNYCKDEQYQEKWISINNKKYTWLVEINDILCELYKRFLLDAWRFASFSRRSRNNYHLVRNRFLSYSYT